MQRAKKNTELSKYGEETRSDGAAVKAQTWNHNDTFPYTRGLRLFISTVFSSTYTCTSSFRAEVSLYSN